MRTPNSRVRRSTDHASTLNVPTAATTSAMQASATSSAAVKRGPAVASSTALDIVETVASAISGSASRTAARTAGTTASGSLPCARTTRSIRPKFHCVYGT